MPFKEVIIRVFMMTKISNDNVKIMGQGLKGEAAENYYLNPGVYRWSFIGSG